MGSTAVGHGRFRTFATLSSLSRIWVLSEVVVSRLDHSAFLLLKGSGCLAADCKALN